MSTLNASAVHAAALSIVDTKGPDKLTMRTVAAELGVEAPSLYHHVSNKAALVDGIVNALVAEVVLPAAGLDRAGAVRAWARAWRSVLDAHPNAVRLVGARPSLALGLVERSESTLADLATSGLSDDAARDLLRTTLVFVLGHAELVHGGPAAGGWAETWYGRGVEAIAVGFGAAPAAAGAAATEEAGTHADEEQADTHAMAGAAGGDVDGPAEESTGAAPSGDADAPVEAAPKAKARPKAKSKARPKAEPAVQAEPEAAVQAEPEAPAAVAAEPEPEAPAAVAAEPEPEAAVAAEPEPAPEPVEVEPKPAPEPVKAAPPRPATPPRPAPEPERRGGLRGRLRGLLGRDR